MHRIVAAGSDYDKKGVVVSMSLRLKHQHLIVKTNFDGIIFLRMLQLATMAFGVKVRGGC